MDCASELMAYYICRRRRDDMIFAGIENWEKRMIKNMTWEEKKIHLGMLKKMELGYMD